MRILFYGEDKSMRQMAESLTNVESVYCDDSKEAYAVLESWNKERGEELEVFIVLLDFSIGQKELDKFAKKTKRIEGLFRCALAYSDDLKELKSYQKTKWACDGQLIGPMDLKSLQNIVSDFETVYYLNELEEDEEIDLLQLESDAAQELQNLDDDKEDYDTTESNRVLPDEFRKGELGQQGDQTAPHELEPLNEGHDPKNEGYEKNPTHKKIQEVFDHIFKDDAQLAPPSLPEDGAEIELPEDDGTQESSSQSEVSMTSAKKEDTGLEFELPEDDQSGEVLEMAPENAQESTGEDELEFDLSEESPEEVTDEQGKPAEQEENQASNDEFEFDHGEEEMELSETNDELSTQETNDSDSSEADQEGTFAFDFEDEEDDTPLDLGSADDQAEAEPENISDEVSPGDLSLDENKENENEDGLSFELGGASSSEAEESHDQDEDETGESFEEEFGELDLSDDAGDVEETKVATGSLKDLQNSDSEDSTRDQIDRTISEIVMGEESSVSDENSTGEFDLPENLPQELTEDMLSEDETNPTMITSSREIESEKSDEAEVHSFEPSDDDEEDFDFSAIESSEPESEDIDKTIVQGKSINQEVKQERAQAESHAPMGGLGAYGEDELSRLQSTIRQLREEREENYKEIQELQKENRLVEQQGLSEKAELDELKIEISILKKRHKSELEELRYQLKLAEEKKQIYEERCKNYQKEFERLNQKVRIEFNQVKQREKELESQLELVTMDTESQVQSRDGKILELKRKIDSLEFNMENASIREQKSREDKARLEERLTKIMSTLRGSIQLLEDEDGEDETGLDTDTDDNL